MLTTEPLCPQCLKRPPCYDGAIWCGSACAARAEAHEPPEVPMTMAHELRESLREAVSTVPGTKLDGIAHYLKLPVRGTMTDGEMRAAILADIDRREKAEAVVSSSADTVESAAMTDEQAEILAVRMPETEGGLAE